jgi:hypothetical protein
MFISIIVSLTNAVVLKVAYGVRATCLEVGINQSVECKGFLNDKHTVQLDVALWLPLQE